MFHQGDLQSGIARAIQESKLVVCFVRIDSNDQCREWEEEWLGNSDEPAAPSSTSLGSMLATKAILLKIEFGSQEADFLNAFCPIDNIPTLAVIHNGQVLEKLESGIEKAEFRERLLKVCGLEGMGESQSTTNTTQSDTSQTVEDSSTQPSTNVQRVLSERAQRLEAERQKREAAEKAERIARANARRKEAEDAAGAGSNATQRPTATTEERDKQQTRDAWLYQQKQRKDEAKKERERILSQIEHDKQERRAQKERQREAQEAVGGGKVSSLPRSSAIASSSVRMNFKSCALQIRLFDGTSIRGNFAPEAILADTVRNWIKDTGPEGAADVPYTFRQILAPQPSRNIEVSEEHQSLLDLGLAPNATLVLVPVAGYTNAYESAGGGYLGSAWNAASWFASTATSALGSAVSYIPVVNRLYPGESAEAPNPVRGSGTQVSGSNSGSWADNTKVKTLFDQRVDHDRSDKPATFYNGNSSAFQGSGPPKGKDAED